MSYRCAIAISALFLAILPSGAVDFEADILPTLEVSCFKCHSDKMERPKAGLRLDSREGIEHAIAEIDLYETGKGADSYLVEVMSLPKGDTDAMPPAGKAPSVSPVALEALIKWIDEGGDFGEWEKFEHPVVERGTSGLTEAAKDLPDDRTIAAAAIDELVREKQPDAYASAVVDDETFLRRTALLILGRGLAPEETAAWLESGEPLDRAAVVDSMLDSPGHVSRQFNYWANVLRANTKQLGNPKNVWLSYLKRSLAENKPYDEWVHEMFTASGYSFENPAIGFHSKDQKNRLAGYEAAVSVFLGTEVGCAQCHDHPFEPITRRDYFEMYGYFAQTHGGVGQSKGFFKNIGRDGGEAVQSRLKKERKGKSIYGEEADRYVAGHHIFGHEQAMGGNSFNYRGSFGIRLPKDYQYDDGKPDGGIQPETLFGVIPEIELEVFKGDRPMEVLADWTTSPENLKFTHVIANRMWEQVFGYPLLGPSTNIVAVEKSTHPALADYLAGLMVKLDYDLRAFQEVLYSTDLYQRTITIRDDVESHVLTPPALRRLSAEQIWDSVVALAIEDSDAKVLDIQEPDWSYQIAARNVESEEELYDLIAEQAKSLTGRAEKAKVAREEQRRLQARGFLREDLVRASELVQPAPAGHFLSLFGQAPRETIEDQWKNPTTPQALTLLNGPLFGEVVREGSPLHAAWAAADSDAARIAAVYRAMLGRTPTEREGTIIADRVEIGSGEGFADLAWSLLNTQEFLFLR